MAAVVTAPGSDARRHRVRNPDPSGSHAHPQPVVPLDPHADCAPKRCTVVERFLGTNPVPETDQARLLEVRISELLQHAGLRAQHQPRTGLFTDEGTEIEPDVGFCNPTASGPYRTSRGEPVTDVLEVKMQTNGGTADQKLEGTTLRYARLSDDYQLVSTIVSALCPASVPAARIAAIRRHAHSHLVGFLTLEDLTPATVCAESDRIRVARTELARTQLATSLADRFDPAVLATAARIAERRQEL